MNIQRWRQAVELGFASRACDLIVKERNAPPEFIAAIVRPLPIPHGTSAGYRTFDCRCPACRAYKRDENRRFR